MKKLFFLFFLFLGVFAFGQESKIITNIQIVTLEKDFYCAIDKDIVKYEKGSKAVAQLVNDKNICADSEAAAVKLRDANLEKIKNEKLFAKIIHSVALLLLLTLLFVILKYKQKKLYITIPFIASFAVFEFLFLFFDINLVVIGLNQILFLAK